MDKLRYEDLTAMLGKEKDPGLSAIPDDFYTDVQDLNNELELMNTEIKSKRHSDRALIQFELNNIQSVVEKIFKKRTHKIVRLATRRAFSDDSSKTSHDIGNMAPGEVEVYHQILNTLLSNGDTTINPIFGPIACETVAACAVPAVVAPPVEVPLIETDKDVKKKPSQDNIVIRLLKDIPAFIGVDGNNYSLRMRDVAFIPKINANALIKRKVAEAVNIG